MNLYNTTGPVVPDKVVALIKGKCARDCSSTEMVYVIFENDPAIVTARTSVP